MHRYQIYLVCMTHHKQLNLSPFWKMEDNSFAKIWNHFILIWPGSKLPDLTSYVSHEKTAKLFVRSINLFSCRLANRAGATTFSPEFSWRTALFLARLPILSSLAASMTHTVRYGCLPNPVLIPQSDRSSLSLWTIIDESCLFTIYLPIPF